MPRGATSAPSSGTATLSPAGPRKVQTPPHTHTRRPRRKPRRPAPRRRSHGHLEPAGQSHGRDDFRTHPQGDLLPQAHARGLPATRRPRGRQIGRIAAAGPRQRPVAAAISDDETRPIFGKFRRDKPRELRLAPLATCSARQVTPHQNERHMSVKMPRRASFQRQDTAHTAHTAHTARHPNPQVRRPFRPSQGSPRTPHDASSETDRTPASAAVRIPPRGSRPSRGRGRRGRRRRRRCGGG